MARRDGSRAAARGTEGACLRDVDEACRRIAIANQTGLFQSALWYRHFNSKTDDIRVQ
jgi:hypothetical protein